MIDWLKLLVSMSISGTILFGVWLISRWVFKKKLTKRSRYCLLLVVLLRFVLPFNSENSVLEKVFRIIETTPVYEQFFGEPEKDKLVIIGDPSTVIIGDNVVIGNNQVKKSKYPAYTFYIWILVALLFFIRKLTRYQSFTKYVKSNWKPVDDPKMLDILSTICEEKNIKRPIDMYTTPLIMSPLLLGLRKSYIVLPHENLTDTQLYSVLLHELTHYKKKDLLFKWFTQLVVCIHWFNPVVYYIEKVLNKECEFSCDEEATKYLSEEEKQAYGLTLIEMTKHPGMYKESVASITLYESKKDIMSRLEAIRTYRKPTFLLKIFSCTLLFLFVLLALKLGTFGNTNQPKEATGKMSNYLFLANE